MTTYVRTVWPGDVYTDDRPQPRFHVEVREPDAEGGAVYATLFAAPDEDCPGELTWLEVNTEVAGEQVRVPLDTVPTLIHALRTFYKEQTGTELP